MLLVARPGSPPLVVKDFSRRSALVRALVAPLLVRHELAMLERVAGLPGVPAPAGRIDRLALAMEYVDGAPLRRRVHQSTLSPAFFDALEGLLEGLAARGVAYLDLRSPSNILVTRTGAPVLVDLASALPFRLPGFLRRAFERRALAKLRRRFEQGGMPAEPLEVVDDPVVDLHFGSSRIRVQDHGALEDPVPVVFLPDAGFSSALFEPAFRLAAARGRRALGIDLPGFGASRVHGARHPDAAARALASAVDALRLARFDLVGQGFGGLVARALACERPGRVRALVAIDAPAERLEGPFLACWQAAEQGASALRAALRRGLSPELPAAQRARLERELAAAPDAELVQVFRELPVRTTPDGVVSLTGLPEPACRVLALQGAATAAPFQDGSLDAEQLWRALEQLSA